jgi:hypothetical protein
MLRQEAQRHLARGVTVLKRLRKKFKIDYLQYKIGKLTVKPDDIIVLSTDLMLDKEQARQLQERAKAWFPNNKVCVISHGIKFGVIRKEDQ